MKKNFKYILFLSILFLVLMPGVSAEETVGGCAVLGGENSNTVKLLSWGVRLLRFGIPIMVIILGIIDFLKILFSGEEKVFKDAFNTFMKRIMIGIITIFVPYILYFIVTLSGVDKQYGIDNFFCGIIDATSGVKIDANNYKNSKDCFKYGYYWLSESNECVEQIKNKYVCENNNYRWENGFCYKPLAQNITNKYLCEYWGYTWDLAGVCKEN